MVRAPVSDGASCPGATARGCSLVPGWWSQGGLAARGSRASSALAAWTAHFVHAGLTVVSLRSSARNIEADEKIAIKKIGNVFDNIVRAGGPAEMFPDHSLLAVSSCS